MTDRYISIYLHIRTAKSAGQSAINKRHGESHRLKPLLLLGDRMKSSGKYGQGRAGSGDACGTTSIEEIVHTIVELSSLCAESARAGGDAWYEMSVYVHPRGLGFQVQRHGSVVGGDAPPPAHGERSQPAERASSASSPSFSSAFMRLLPCSCFYFLPQHVYTYSKASFCCA